MANLSEAIRQPLESRKAPLRPGAGDTGQAGLSPATFWIMRATMAVLPLWEK